MKTQINNKLIIFDWGGVIESHSNDVYNFDLALIRLFKRLNTTLQDEQIIEVYAECY